ncbi:protein of unknown function [Candidatus Hydrogenisulfobacillus filiaventi]|uniref:GGDEF domain-containing protein n=1 Tax=Candidatus Hydrogenisulfobacillus filiaventi TaxID=2707344 RepID=A0A6F8ZE03_9FIRM|nr:hypothetical protein [Bacillota bacterium]CAB1127985.1 protein of unknown function [Candidatus Hydrogenisulfobacillus filiaventi]
MSLGLTWYPADPGDVTCLLHHADRALYRATAGKGRRRQWWAWWRPRAGLP